MNRTDKFLVGIVAGIVLLVVAGFAVALLRPKPAYQPDSTPSGTAHNYLLALTQGDYAQAYIYLSPTVPGYPETLTEFIADAESHRYAFGRDQQSTLNIESTHTAGRETHVTVRETAFYNRGLFNSGESTSSFDVRLVLRSGKWSIVGAGRYWANCWDYDRGCR